MKNGIGRRTFIKNASLGPIVTLMASETRAQKDQAAYDVVIYGDSSGAVTAAIAAKRQGCSVVLINPTDFLGQRSTIGGVASEFYDAIAAAYGKKYVRSFEPHVGQKTFGGLISDADVKVVFNERLNRKNGSENGRSAYCVHLSFGFARSSWLDPHGTGLHGAQPERHRCCQSRD